MSQESFAQTLGWTVDLLQSIENSGSRGRQISVSDLQKIAEVLKVQQYEIIRRCIGTPHPQEAAHLLDLAGQLQDQLDGNLLVSKTEYENTLIRTGAAQGLTDHAEELKAEIALLRTSLDEARSSLRELDKKNGRLEERLQMSGDIARGRQVLITIAGIVFGVGTGVIGNSFSAEDQPILWKIGSTIVAVGLVIYFAHFFFKQPPDRVE